jgi:hypothetical protein
MRGQVQPRGPWEYCRQWIDRVEPFFVCILGQRYGHRPEPRELRDPAEQARQQARRRSRDARGTGAAVFARLCAPTGARMSRPHLRPWDSKRPF